LACVLAHVAQELERRHGLGPVGVVDQRGGVEPGLEVEQSLQLDLDGGHVGAQGVAIEEVALVAAPARVAHHPGGPAGQGERPVPGQLEPAQRQLAEQVAEVERVGGGIETDIHPDRPVGQALGQRLEVGGVVDQPTSLQVGDDVHTALHVRRTAPLTD